jgi:hypothetical protein
MNRTSRHELAERMFVKRHVRLPTVFVRASTTAPFDLQLLTPVNGSFRSTFVEVKTSQGRRTSDLSRAEADFGRFAEKHGSPYVIARFRVLGDRVVSERLYRPFSVPEIPDAEITFEVKA